MIILSEVVLVGLYSLRSHPRASWAISITPSFNSSATVFGISSANTPVALILGTKQFFQFFRFFCCNIPPAFWANTKPIYSGFSSFAVSISQRRKRPQNFYFRHNAAPAVHQAWPFLTGALISDSPIKTASAPISRIFAISPALLTRFRKQTVHPEDQFSEVCGYYRYPRKNSLRLRLLTPITRAPALSAICTSLSLCASTRAESPSVSQMLMYSLISILTQYGTDQKYCDAPSTFAS